VANQAPQNFASRPRAFGRDAGRAWLGYVVFFTYSALLGVFAVLLSLVVERRQRTGAGESAARNA
jgi:hypothetical protein